MTIPSEALTLAALAALGLALVPNTPLETEKEK